MNLTSNPSLTSLLSQTFFQSFFNFLRISGISLFPQSEMILLIRILIVIDRFLTDARVVSDDEICDWGFLAGLAWSLGSLDAGVET